MLELYNKDNLIFNTDYTGIFVNFTENNQHGCKNKCSFCPWRYADIGKIRMCPTNENLNDFLKIMHSTTVYISGGGDPLYNYEKNKKELDRIINFLHSKDRVVEIMTTEYELVKKEYDKSLSSVDLFAFSLEKIDANMIELFKKIGKNRIRISKIINQNTNMNFIDKYINFYKDYVKQIVLRPNYIDTINSEKYNLLDKLQLKYPKTVFLLPICEITVLINNKIYLVQDLNKLLMEGVQKKRNKIWHN